jgi:hypothetical protein
VALVGTILDAAQAQFSDLNLVCSDVLIPPDLRAPAESNPRLE